MSRADCTISRARRAPESRKRTAAEYAAALEAQENDNLLRRAAGIETKQEKEKKQKRERGMGMGR